MSEKKFIGIMGPDGAGKSTQARLLIEKLTNEGFDCRYAWLRFSHIISLPLLAIARILGYSHVESLESGRKIGYHNFDESFLLSRIYPMVLFVDVFVIYVFKILAPRYFWGKTIVCDRYIYDTIVHIVISTGREEFFSTYTCKAFISLIPQDSTFFILNGQEEILRLRRDDVEADDTLEEQIRLYAKISDVYDIQTIDIEHSKEEIHSSICGELGIVS